MYRGLILGLLLSAGSVVAQTSGSLPANLPNLIEISSSADGMVVLDGSSNTPFVQASADDLPDSPGTVQTEDAVAIGKTSLRARGKDQPASCNVWRAVGMIYFDPRKVDEPRPHCSELVYPYQRFLDTNIAIPLNWKQKGYLAVHYTTDPSSLGTIVGISAINIAVDSHTAYGPGWEGFGKLAGVSLLQNATAEFFGTFAVPSLVHQDPRYFRMPHKPIGKRILYSVTRSYVSRSDDGRTIPNYSVLATYPIIAELGNLYVPGIESDGASTAKRILTGYALDPVNNLVNEFLPDVAKRVHVRIIFVQQILNNIAVTGGGPM
jgi:hypothetical protein